jgi:ribosomal protein S21|tara:strand:+ start:569 stop:766 length:198 start_codon:yes stop_codon:yes gene_type:complete
MAGKCVNVQVKISDTRGDFNRMVKRFIKKVKKEKIIDTYKERRFYEKPSDRKRREKRRAQRTKRS